MLSDQNITAQLDIVGICLSLEGSRNCWWLPLVAMAAIRRVESIYPVRTCRAEGRQMKGTRKTVFIKTWFSMGLAAHITEKEEIGREDIWRTKVGLTCLLGWGAYEGTVGGTQA